jgi:homoserine kinase type II
VWEYLPSTVDVEAGLSPARLAAVGEVVGRLHQATAGYPGLPALVESGVQPCIDVAGQPQRLHHLGGLVDAATDLAPTERRWLRHSYQHRLAVWPRIRDLIAALPPLIQQVGHGDLAAVNVLWPASAAPVLIDFRRPHRAPMLYDLSRIALDPRTIVARPDWLDGLLACVRGYRRTHPALRTDDLRSGARFWVAYTACSNYPLAALAR